MSKIKQSRKGLYEIPQEIITEQATLELFTPTKPINLMQEVLPRLNRHMKLVSLRVIEDAVRNYPDKVDKIILYANTVDEDVLASVFSNPTF